MPIKNGEERSEQIIKIRKNKDYTTGNLYKIIAIGLSKQIELENSDLK